MAAGHALAQRVAGAILSLIERPFQGISLGSFLGDQAFQADVGKQIPRPLARWTKESLASRFAE